ncbi:uncharacterized protein TNCV_3447581 [Trichonephila clavipes]|nr:uncharacterized protein TNCV_3447581 [Trichonephila clavipes]
MRLLIPEEKGELFAVSNIEMDVNHIFSNGRICVNAEFCKSKVLCKCCLKKHHSSLCFSGDPNLELASEKGIQPSSLGMQKEREREESWMGQLSAKASVLKPINYTGEISSHGVGDLFTATSYIKSKSVLLSTTICFIRDSFGEMQEVRGLLDGGSTSNFISQQCMNRLNLKREKINILVSGLNNSELTIKSCVNATIANRGNSYETNADIFVVPRITDMIPSQPFNVSLEYSPRHIASGSIPVSSENKPHCGLIKDNVDLEKTMRRFWKIENVEPETIKNKETIICEEHFLKNHTRDNTGRYIVSMPFKKDPNCLGQSKDIALKKLNSLWNRLKREPNYLKLYKDFLKEYKEIGQMQEVDEKEECGIYFIPHLGVYRSDKKQVN